MIAEPEYPDILELLRQMGVSERALRKLRARRKLRRRDRPLCGARRRDGGTCQAHAVLDADKARPLHGGRCRMHGGLSTGPRTEAGRAAIAESNRRRVNAAAKALLDALELFNRQDSQLLQRQTVTTGQRTGGDEV